MDAATAPVTKKRHTNGALPRGGTHLRETVSAAVKNTKARSVGMRMQHDVDPALSLMDKLGDLRGVEVLNNYVLYAIYERPAKTAGGVYLTDQQQTEDEYQGKAGLIIKIGPLVNLDPELRGGELKPGMWIAVRPSDGWALKINGVHCRMIIEKGVHMVLPTPDTVY